ncbi:hypothetical protein GSU75_02230 [Pseudomonas savastanoi pv. phaseolicola]|nr:hypothetical protein [Pseudomonas savastanoi]MBN4175009.1 hypothetical protein [Pseudomonas savastanoi pv. phaseolicola]
MYKMIAALTFLAITSATLTGCNDKGNSEKDFLTLAKSPDTSRRAFR